MKKLIILTLLTSSISFCKNGIPAINELSQEQLALIHQTILEEEQYQKEMEEKNQAPIIQNQEKEKVAPILEKEEVVTGKSLYFNNSNEIKIKIGQYKNEFKRISEKAEDTKNQDKQNSTENKNTKEKATDRITESKEN